MALLHFCRMAMHWFAIVLLTLAGSSMAHDLVGYDCGGRGLNISRISLLDVGACDIPRKPVNSTTVRIRLYQKKKFDSVRVIQCRVLVRRVITDCGAFSFGRPVAGGIYDYLEDLSREQCENMHNTGVMTMGNGVTITGLLPNSTDSRSITLAGKLTNDGSCKGTQYSDRHATYEDVVVQASLWITLTEYTTTANRANNVLHLKSGVNCVLNKGRCVDNIGGHTFWKDEPVNECKFEQFDKLYDGYAIKMVTPDEEANPIYSAKSNDTAFSIMGKGNTNICGYIISSTEHPRLFISEMKLDEVSIKYGLYDRSEQYILTENLDFITYVNAKIVHVERHVRTHMKSLYYELTLQRCLLERKVIQNQLTIASIRPDEFAYNLMEGPGYMAVVTGEIVRLIKCTPVPVTVKRVTTCYLELPVMKDNTTYYLTPKTHILLRKGTEVLCDGAIPSTYKLGNSWYEITPKAFKAERPETLQPTTIPTWKYENPGNLATMGLYTVQELENLNERILFPMEQPAVLNTLARAAAGQEVDTQGITMERFINEESLANLVDSFWYRAWSKFEIFGNTAAGIIGILLVVRILKGFIDTILQGFALHSVYGWSLKLLGALFTSVTQFLLHMANQDQGTNMRPPTECIPTEEGEELVERKATKPSLAADCV